MNKKKPNNGEFEKLTDELEKQQLLIQDYTDTLKRLQAEFDNHLKRSEKEKQEYTKFASHKLVLKLLNILDDFERAKEQAKTTGNKELLQGLELIHKVLNKTLEEEGVKQIEINDKKFDPYKHEALSIVEGEEDNVILEELQRGYMLYDKILRTSKVKISKTKGETENV